MIGRLHHAFWLLILACWTSVASAQTAPEATPIVVGQSYRLASTIMPTTRTINIWLPPGYADGGKRYPVLYLLDGGVDQDFHHISGLAQLGTVNGTTRDVIVVGIETVDRRNELAFPTTDPALKAEYPTAGDSARFRRFIADEVKPWVEHGYRTDGTDAVMGESLAGLFVVETLLRQPALFDQYIAISPSLWWDNQSLLTAARPMLPGTAGRTLWLSVANEQGMGVTPFADLLRTNAPAGLTWTFAPMPNETHASIYHGAAMIALRHLFAQAEAE
ncbi:alpha/beta hydrolase [Sphingomonas sp. CJ99]